MHARARGLADSAVAVPLRKASAGGRSENTNAHATESETQPRGSAGAASRLRRLAMVQVGSYLGAELDDLKTWLDPLHIASCHICLPLGCGFAMKIEITASDPYTIGADLVATAAGPRASELGAHARAGTEADAVAVVYTAAGPLVVVALEPEVDGVRTAAARAVRTC